MHFQWWVWMEGIINPVIKAMHKSLYPFVRSVALKLRQSRQDRTLLLITCLPQQCHTMCADLHPGNILVALDPPPGPLLSSAAYILDRFKPFGWKVPSSWREPAIVLLDVGRSSPELISHCTCKISVMPECLRPKYQGSSVDLWHACRHGHASVAQRPGPHAGVIPSLLTPGWAGHWGLHPQVCGHQADLPGPRSLQTGPLSVLHRDPEGAGVGGDQRCRCHVSCAGARPSPPGKSRLS